jgi:hypothetical protein
LINIIMAMTRCATLKRKRIADDSNGRPATSINPEPSTATDPVQKLGFFALPPELRVKIYRHAFVTSRRISFPQERKSRRVFTDWTKWHFPLSAQPLWTCKTCLVEGCSILYEENTFQATRPGAISNFIRRRVGNAYYFILIKHVAIGSRSRDWANYWISNKWGILELRALENLVAIQIMLPTFRLDIKTSAVCNSTSIISVLEARFQNGGRSVNALVQMSSKVQISLKLEVIGPDPNKQVNFSVLKYL